MTVSVLAFDAERAPAARLAEALGAPMGIVRIHRFPDGETLPRLGAPIPETVVLYVSLDHPNAKVVNLLLAADACRRAGARRLLLVAPYFCYLRQDAVFTAGEPLSRDVIGPLVAKPFDAVITVQAHLHRTVDLGSVLGVPTSNLSAVEVLAKALPSYDAPPLVVGPDQESAPWAAAFAARLGGESVTPRKVRSGDRRVRIELPTPLIAGDRAAVVVDDVASSGETLEAAVRCLRGAGAASIDVAIAHALMDNRAAARLRCDGVREIVSTDSIAHSTNAAPLAELLARQVRRTLEDA